MENLNKKLKSWQILCFSMPGIIFIIFIIFFLFNFNIAFNKSHSKKIDLENVQVIAIKATNSSKLRLAVYKDKRKIFTSPSLDNINLCESVGFSMKINAERIIGIQQTKSTFFFCEIHFTDGNIYKILDKNQAKYFIEKEKESITNHLLFL